MSGDEAHHAVAVRRLRVGEGVVLTDGAGHRVAGSVAETGKRVFAVTVARWRRSRPSRPFTVVQALPKGDRGELAVEVLTEIGVDTVVPWAASRSVAVWKGERAAKSLARWRPTAREAGKQSRRSWLPEVDALASTDARSSTRVAGADLAVVLHEDGHDVAGRPRRAGEGEDRRRGRARGWDSPEEVAAFEAAGPSRVRLGAEVLRTSTAGVAAVSALLARTPRWR